MSRRFLITAIVAAAVTVPAAAAPIRGQTLMPGVIYSKQVEFTSHGPVVLNVVSTPRPGGLYSIRAALSNGAVAGREKLTEMQKALSGTSTVVGVNGDLFDTRWGTPSSVLLRGGLLFAGSSGGRSAAGFDAAGGLHVDRVSVDGAWQGTGQYRPLGLNEAPGRSSTTLYTSAWGGTTPGEQGTTEVVLSQFPAATPNVTLTASVAQVAQSGPQPIPPGGAVLVARGRQAATLAAEAPAGGRVSVRLILTPRWNDVVEAVGGGPALVRNGRSIFRANELFSTRQLFTRVARTAVGQTADGRIILAAVDGGRPGYSAGVTNFELALAMTRLGVVNACALGTGGATALAFDGKLLSRPTRGEIPVADALLFAYEGVYAPAPATTPAPAVGKAVALVYKVVRRSTVTATITGASGTATLDAGVRDAGSYRFDWTPPAAGRWTFTVSADDDLGRRSGAERTITVG